MTTEQFLIKHQGHSLSAQPYIAEGGWDARLLECQSCGDGISQVRAMPAEGCLIDSDPHLVAGRAS